MSGESSSSPAPSSSSAGCGVGSPDSFASLFVVVDIGSKFNESIAFPRLEKLCVCIVDNMDEIFIFYELKNRVSIIVAYKNNGPEEKTAGRKRINVRWLEWK